MDYNEEDPAKKCISETSTVHLVSMDSLNELDICGHTSVSPRIGDEYQATLPPVLNIEALPSRVNQKLGLNNESGTNQTVVRFGLPIPVMWVPSKIHHAHDENKKFSDSMFATDNIGQTDTTNGTMNEVSGIPSLVSQNSYDGPSGKTCKVEASNGIPHPEKGFITSEPLKDGSLSTPVDVRVSELQIMKFRDSDCVALPGSQSICWTDVEIENFLLGLYIFGKNFVNMVKFMECKKMGDILSFYYGKFYRSDVHQKWSEHKKLKNRRCILGQRIFSGWRQEELLSRLLPIISKQKQEHLKQVALSFSDGRVSLEEYVFTLKGIAGIPTLVQAIGIGKGKHDLTRVALDPIKTNRTLPLPKGKAFSSLTSADIVTYLTGNFRLSKTRSSDLFWEAVWPRLLARGWHSEQPKNEDYVTSDNSLVFLVPGVKKFSRRKLVKGNDYFDSVSDVLGKVASEPRLLELEAEMTNENVVRDEKGCVIDSRPSQTNQSENEGHSHPCPSLASCTLELVKFTVVGTSQAQGVAPKIRELSSLPSNGSWSCVSSDPSNDNCSNNTNKQQDSCSVSLNHPETFDSGIHSVNKLGNTMKYSPKEMQDVQFLHEYISPKKKAKNRQHSVVPHNNSLSGLPIKDMKHRKHRVKSRSVSLKHVKMIDPDIRCGKKQGNEMKCLSKKIPSVKFLHEVSASKKMALNKSEMDSWHSNRFNEQPIKVIKCQKHRENSDKPIYLSPVSRKRRLTVCMHSQSDHYSYIFSKKHHLEEMANCQFKDPIGDVKEGSDQARCEECTSSSGIGIENDSGEFVASNNLNTIPSTKKVLCDDGSQHKLLIDLNEPYYPSDFDPAEPCNVESINSQCDLSVNHALSVGTEKHNDESQAPSRFAAGQVEQQHNESARRQSTRNRSPTAKALEAVASGFLNL